MSSISPSCHRKRHSRKENGASILVVVIFLSIASFVCVLLLDWMNEVKAERKRGVVTEQTHVGPSPAYHEPGGYIINF